MKFSLIHFVLATFIGCQVFASMNSKTATMKFDPTTAPKTPVTKAPEQPREPQVGDLVVYHNGATGACASGRIAGFGNPGYFAIEIISGKDRGNVMVNVPTKDMYRNQCEKSKSSLCPGQIVYHEVQANLTEYRGIKAKVIGLALSNDYYSTYKYAVEYLASGNKVVSLKPSQTKALVQSKIGKVPTAQNAPVMTYPEIAKISLGDIACEISEDNLSTTTK